MCGNKNTGKLRFTPLGHVPPFVQPGRSDKFFVRRFALDVQLPQMIQSSYEGSKLSRSCKFLARHFCLRHQGSCPRLHGKRRNELPLHNPSFGQCEFGCERQPFISTCEWDIMVQRECQQMMMLRENSFLFLSVRKSDRPTILIHNNPQPTTTHHNEPVTHSKKA